MTRGGGGSGEPGVATDGGRDGDADGDAADAAGIDDVDDAADAADARGTRTTRIARIGTRHDAPGLVAAAIRPDNTDSMDTTVDGGRVRTRVERGTTGGLGSSVDDYVVNLRVAERVVADARERTRADDRTDGLGGEPDATGDGNEDGDEESANSETNDTDANTDSDTTP